MKIIALIFQVKRISSLASFCLTYRTPDIPEELGSFGHDVRVLAVAKTNFYLAGKSWNNS